MLKSLKRTFPWLLIALLVGSVATVIDGLVAIKMVGLIDLAATKNLTEIQRQVPILLVCVVATIPVSLFSAYLAGVFKKKANMSMRSYYLTRLFDKHIDEFQKENNAVYISAITNDCNTLETNLIEGIYSIGIGIANFLVGIWMLSTVGIWFIVVSMIVVGINIYLSIKGGHPVQKQYRERSDLMEKYTIYVKEVLAAFHIIKNYNLEDKITKDYYDKSKDIQWKGYRIEKLLSKIEMKEIFVMNASVYFALFSGGYFVVRGTMSISSILLIMQGIQRIGAPMMDISEILPKLFTTKELIHKMEQSLENKNQIKEELELDQFQDVIRLDHVDFSYDMKEDNQVLEDVTLQLKKAGKYLFVGPSGGGKSTLLKLLRKYYVPTSGVITIDGKDLKYVKRDQFYHLIANVEQQVFIFEDTLKNNITLYKEYTKQEIDQALEGAGLLEFAQQLPQGIESMIYENGKNISGGERSRIVIARALLAKASILFMDEAYASLDMERAKEIEQTILSLKDMTVINVSHVIFKETKNQYDQVFTVKKQVKM